MTLGFEHPADIAEDKYIEVISNWKQIEEDGPFLRIGLLKESCGPDELWEFKDLWYQYVKESKEIWSEMDLTDREIVLNIVRDGLVHLQDNLEEWVPQVLTKISGEAIDVSFLILFGQVERSRRVQKTERDTRIEQAKRQLSDEIESGTTLDVL